MILETSLKKSENIYCKFLGFLVKKGSRILGKQILDKAFIQVTVETMFSRQVSLTKLFRGLNSFVEVKKVRVRRRFVLVPFPISLKRRSYLIVKWIMQAITKDERKTSFSNKLTKEILSTLSDASARTVLLKRLNLSQALANRSNVHFRW